jgi:neutral ceramidase
MRAGAASLPLDPPLGLPMLGFVRQIHVATGTGWPLETGAVVLEQGETRVVLCGVDIVGLQAPASDRVIDRIAEACGCDPAAVLLSWNHTHLAPPGDERMALLAGAGADSDEMRRSAAAIQDRMVEVCRLALERLEPAEPVWAVGEVDEAVNRRERTADGRTILGWNPDRQLDRQVTALQLRRPDETAVATLVGFGCHPVTTGYDMDIYSADFPGPMRDLVRSATGGECVFLQGSAGDVLPRVAFTQDEREAERLGRRIALEALHALADRHASGRRVVRGSDRSVTPISIYRIERGAPAEPVLAAARERVDFPLQPLLPGVELAELRRGAEQQVEEARARDDRGAAKVAGYTADWARRTEARIQAGTATPTIDAPIHAIRIGDGVIVTGPGETFTEIGLAVKQRAPGRPTLYCGYANGLVTYFPTADEYPHGGYEPGYGNRSFDLWSQVAPGAERILVETGVRLAERLFPGCEPWPDEAGWTALAGAPDPPPGERLVHPDAAEA